MIATILNVAAVIVGPVFLALAVVPLTRRFAAGWFGVLVGGCATQALALRIVRLMGAKLTIMRTLFTFASVAFEQRLNLLAAFDHRPYVRPGRAVREDSEVRGDCQHRL